MDEIVIYQSCTGTVWGRNIWCYPEVSNEYLAYWMLGFLTILTVTTIGLILIQRNSK